MLFLTWLVNGGLIYTLISSIGYLPDASWQAIVLMIVTLVLIVIELVVTVGLFATTTSY